MTQTANTVTIEKAEKQRTFRGDFASTSNSIIKMQHHKLSIMQGAAYGKQHANDTLH
jgi:hypothetical protein